MNIVILTRLAYGNSGKHLEMIEQLHARGIGVQAVVATRMKFTELWQLYGMGMVKKIWEKLRHRRMTAGRDDSAIRSDQSGVKAPHVFMIKKWGSAAAIHILRTLKPDLCIALGPGILKKALLEIPRLGILGGHFGILPRYRGMNVTEWAFFHNDPVGVSIQWINAGIDTGNIITTRHIPLDDDDTIASLREKSNLLCNSLLIEIIEKLCNGGTVPALPQKISQGKQYFVMHPRFKKCVEQKLRTYHSL